MSIEPTRDFSTGISLRDVLPEAQAIGAHDIVFQTACGKWDECETDDLYVAVSETEVDGHDLAQSAIARGTNAIVCERLLPISVPQFIVDDSRIAYGKICHALAGRPTERISTIAVAGTAGKTVVSQLIHSVLKAADHECGLSSSIETKFGGSRKSDSIFEPNPAALSSHLATMEIGRCSHAVIEAASQTLAKHVFAGISLDAAVITNLRRNHCELHGSFENYQRANARLLGYLKSTGFAVVNADEKHAIELLDEVSVPALTFGIHQQAEVTGKMLDRCGRFQTFIITAGSESAVIRTSTIGKQHVYNCLAAAAVGLTLGLDLKTIAKGLETANLPGRLERVDCGQEFGIWIDSASSPNHLSGAIAAIAPVCEGKLWCVCATDENHSETQRNQLGTVLERKTERPVISSIQSGLPNSRINYEPFHQVIDGFEDSSMARVVPNRAKAIEWVLSQAKPGDAVLLAGCGHHPIANLEQHPVPMTDRNVCQAILTGEQQAELDEPSIFPISDYQ